jgi:hypothetical protein
MPTEADTTDTTTGEGKRQHARRMLAHLGAQEPPNHSIGDPLETDVATELSAMADAFVLLQRLDEPARRRTLDWLHQKFDAAELRF